MEEQKDKKFQEKVKDKLVKHEKKIKGAKDIFNFLTNLSISGVISFGLEKLTDKIDKTKEEDQEVEKTLVQVIEKNNLTYNQVEEFILDQKKLNDESEKIKTLVAQNQNMLKVFSELFESLIKDNDLNSEVFNKISFKYKNSSKFLEPIKESIASISNPFGVIVDCKENNINDDEILKRVTTYQKGVNLLVEGKAVQAEKIIEEVSYDDKNNNFYSENMSIALAVAQTCSNNYLKASRTITRLKKQKNKYRILQQTFTNHVYSLKNDLNEGEEIPEIDNRYKLIGLLGESGMGVVYQAEDKYSKKKYAIKFIRHDLRNDEKIIARFEKEIDILKQFSSPNIVEYKGHTKHNDNFCIIMEYIDGVNLHEYIRLNKNLGPIDFYWLTKSLLAGLEDIHGDNIIHRDIKPTNIMVYRDEHNRLCGKFIDFGISVYNDVEQATFTSYICNPQFAAEEQIREGKTDYRSDYYSFFATLLYIITYPNIPNYSLAGEYSESYKTFFEKGLAINPNDRFKDFEDINNALFHFYFLEVFSIENSFRSKLFKNGIDNDLHDLNLIFLHILGRKKYFGHNKNDEINYLIIDDKFFDKLYDEYNGDKVFYGLLYKGFQFSKYLDGEVFIYKENDLKNINNAIEFFKKAVKIKKNAEIYLLIGDMIKLLNKRHGGFDEDQNVFYIEAADLGNKIGIEKAIDYYIGNFSYDEIDYKKALYYLKKLNKPDDGRIMFCEKVLEYTENNFLNKFFARSIFVFLAITICFFFYFSFYYSAFSFILFYIFVFIHYIHIDLHHAARLGLWKHRLYYEGYIDNFFDDIDDVIYYLLNNYKKKWYFILSDRKIVEIVAQMAVIENEYDELFAYSACEDPIINYNKYFFRYIVEKNKRKKKNNFSFIDENFLKLVLNDEVRRKSNIDYKALYGFLFDGDINNIKKVFQNECALDLYENLGKNYLLYSYLVFLGATGILGIIIYLVISFLTFITS